MLNVKDPNVGELLGLLADSVDELPLVRFRLLVGLSEGDDRVALGTGLYSTERALVGSGREGKM